MGTKQQQQQPIVLEMQTRFAATSASFVLLCLVAALLGHRAAAAAVEVVNVGVILDMASVTGNRWSTSIRMAVEDYYAAHANATTRVELQFRDSSGDAVAAASAAVDLIKNAKAQAIIDGLRTAAEAEFVARIGDRAHVPVLSFSAAPAARTARFSVAIAPDDSSQAAPIAAVLKNFHWRAAVVLHEDSGFGASIVPALSDALRGVKATVAHRAAVPVDASDDRLDAVLYRASALTARVFVVHMSLPLALRLFRRAKDAGMMSEGYVWIATAAVGDTGADALGSEDTDAMQGVVSVRQYVPPSSQASDFAERLKARIQLENGGSQDTTKPATSTFQAYDTAVAVAAAVEAAGISGSDLEPPQGGGTGPTELDQLGVSATGEKLLQAVRDTTFDGLAGKFSVSDEQPQTPAYEIVNFAADGLKTVGFWTTKTGISPEFAADSGEGLKNVQFPGAGESDSRIPDGWAFSPVERALVVAVPVKHGFQQFVKVSNDTTTGRTTVSGYSIDVFEAAIKALPYPVTYQYVPYDAIGNASSSSYDQMVELIPEEKADAVVGDVSITVDRMADADFTMPYTESGWTMVVSVQTQEATGMFFFLKPLTPMLWVVSLAAFIFTGFVIWVIEHRINPEFRGPPMQQFGIIFHYAFSTLVFAHRENVVSNLSKFLMVIWMFAVLILTSSYTASLTSMLTVQKLRPAVTDVNDLLDNGDYVGYQEGSFVYGELLELKFDPSKLRSYSSPAEYADALSKGSDDGGVTAVFDELPYLKVFLSQYCDGYTLSGPVYKGTGLGFAFPTGSPMATEMSRAIVGLTKSNDMDLIERKWFGVPESCGDGGADAANASLTLWNFSGLFLITAVAAMLVLFIYLVMFIYQERHEVRKEAGPGSGSVSLKRFRAWLQHYDRKDMSAPHFRQEGWSESPSSNGGSSHGRKRGEQDEATPSRDFGGPRASPLSDHSRMDLASASPLERKGSGEFRTPFEQRMGEAAAERRSSTPERRPSLKFPQDTEERKKLPLSP